MPPRAAQMNDVALCANDVLRNDVGLRPMKLRFAQTDTPSAQFPSNALQSPRFYDILTAKGGGEMKKIIYIFLFLSMLVLSSCSALNEGILMPNIQIDHIFENDTWLVVEDRLINKIDGTVYWLEINRNIAIPGVTEFYSDSQNVYKYEFEESLLKQYTFLRVYAQSLTPLYYEYVITFSYDGEEIARSCISDLLTEEEMQKEYANKSQGIEDFRFYVFSSEAGYIWDGFTSINKEETSAEKRAILDFAENLYKSQNDGSYCIMEGLAKPMNDEIWFSTAGSNRRDSVKADSLISGIRETQITAYNRETNDFRTVFKYDKKKTQIIDFDENGAYILDSNGKFGYVDFETRKLTVIYDFPGVDTIFITDKYICVKYQLNGYTYFVYEKGGSVVANDSSLD